MIFVEGYALVSSLGDSAKSSVETMREGRGEPLIMEDGVRFYKIADTKPSDYYDVMVQVAQEAIESANLTKDEIANMALFLGTSSAKLPINEAFAKDEKEILKDLYMSEITAIISDRLGINGFRTIISTACTSSSNALIQAREMIESGLVQKAMVIGVELYNQLSIRGFDSFMLLSKEKIRPFDTNRDGVILGEAVSAVVLGQKQSDIEMVSGSIKVDTSSITSPTPENLAKVMSEAISGADIEPKEIVVVKTHSTATRQNDDAEAKAIHQLFDQTPKVTGLKPYIGHTMGACGSNELVLFIEALKQGFIPKTINFLDADSECNITPLDKEFKAKEGYYLLNYFGFGGNNSSLVIKYSGV